MRQPLLIKTGLALLLLWALAWGLHQWAGSAKPTPEKVLGYLETRPLQSQADDEGRREVVIKVADMLNGLENDQMSQLFTKAAQDPEAKAEQSWRKDFFEAMRPEEQKLFMERRVGRAFDQMMNAFNDMDKEERRTLVKRTLQQMRDNTGRESDIQRLEAADAELAEKVVNEGLRSYYQQANAETKMDLAPLLEQMQQTISIGGGPPRRKR